jgi:hypothetical protein
VIDAGHGVSFEVRSIDGKVYGVGYQHPHQKGEPFVCSGYAPLKPGTSDGWDLVQLEPLTISPSLLCHACGHHGFIREGKWVPA